MVSPVSSDQGRAPGTKTNNSSPAQVQPTECCSQRLGGFRYLRFMVAIYRPGILMCWRQQRRLWSSGGACETAETGAQLQLNLVPLLSNDGMLNGAQGVAAQRCFPEGHKWAGEEKLHSKVLWRRGRRCIRAHAHSCTS